MAIDFWANTPAGAGFLNDTGITAPRPRATRPTGPKGKALMRGPLPPPIPPTPAERPADLLADTIPPTEPPAEVTTAQPRPFDVVRWHINPARVTVEQFASLEAARAHVADLHYAVIWKWAIRDPNPWPHTIDTGTIVPPDDAPPPMPPAPSA